MGMHADCGHGISMATSMAQLHMQAMTADCADAMADAWEDTAGCAQAFCLHGILLTCQYIVTWGLHRIVHM